MKRFLLGLCATFVMGFAGAQEALDYYLPDNVSYDQEIPTPEQFFKQQVGEWHLTHEQVLSYMKEITRISDRAIMYEYARSHENKPLVHLVFTSEENQKNLDELKSLHARYSDPGEDISPEGVPLVVSLTYGVHGNEASGPNASVLTAYHLAAARGDEMEKLLASTIIIVDPCLNPDGFTRNSTWTNMHQGANAGGDDNSRQFYEPWPRSRYNHYWFDLNRDYLLLVHPESKGRVAKFHEWKPNVVTDHHESSANTSFFFQPGVPSRNNPLIPSRNFELTSEIAKYHARYLDQIGSQYFSEESFDDYYFGKGSTYPDINGGIGILFEAAALRGRIRETSNGVKKFSLSIKNHFTVSLSTLEASLNLHDELLQMQKDFYTSALDLSKKSETWAYEFGNENDRVKTRRFVDFLNRHQIDVYKSDRPGSFVVPVQQKQYRLLTSIFEEVTSFRDTAFYDVSTWTFTHAFDIPATRISSAKDVHLSGKPVSAEKIRGTVTGGKSNIGYVFRWNEYSTAEALYRLQDLGLITKVATRGFSFVLGGSEELFSHGTILIPVPQQPLSDKEIFDSVNEIAESTGIDFYGLSTDLSPRGIDMGSGSFSPLEKPEILMFIEGSTSSTMAGEIWHLFDQNYQIPVTNASCDRIGFIDLNRYNNIILPGGTYREWGEKDIQKLQRWVENGGNLIACKEAVKWAAGHGFGTAEFKEEVPPDTTRYLKYNEQEKEYRLNLIGGAILKASMDISHPLCYGYLKEDLAIMKRGTEVACPSGVKYSEPVMFASQPYLSGWVSEKNLERIKDAPVVSVQPVKKGKLIFYHEDLNFRGTWLGAGKLFSNSVFFGAVIR